MHKKVKIKLTYSSFRILLELMKYYINQKQNLEALILFNLKHKLWSKASEEKEIKLSLELFQAAAIKEALLYLPDNLPLAEKNELRNVLFKLDEHLVNIKT